MTVIAEFTSRHFLLEPRPPDRDPDWRVELVRVVPTGEGVIPYLIYTGDNPEGFEDRLPTVNGVTEVTNLTALPDGVLLGVEWDTADSALLRALAEADVSILKGTHDETGLWLQVIAPDRQTVSTFQRTCLDEGMDMELQRVSDFVDAEREPAGRLTEDQYSALKLAMDEGYYDTPRRTDLTEIGDALDISRQAAGNRLRRGTRNLLAAVLDRR